MLARILLILILLGIGIAVAVWVVRYQPFGPTGPVGTQLDRAPIRPRPDRREGPDAPFARLEMATAALDGRIWIRGRVRARRRCDRRAQRVRPGARGVERRAAPAGGRASRIARLRRGSAHSDRWLPRNDRCPHRRGAPVRPGDGKLGRGAIAPRTARRGRRKPRWHPGRLWRWRGTGRACGTTCSCSRTARGSRIERTLPGTQRAPGGELDASAKRSRAGSWAVREWGAGSGTGRRCRPRGGMSSVRRLRSAHSARLRGTWRRFFAPGHRCLPDRWPRRRRSRSTDGSSVSTAKVTSPRSRTCGSAGTVTVTAVVDGVAYALLGGEVRRAERVIHARGAPYSRIEAPGDRRYSMSIFSCGRLAFSASCSSRRAIQRSR